MEKQKTAVLLINLGSPDNPETGAVRAYLKEFLSDPRVLNMPKLLRWLMVNLFIVPFRSPKSAAAYKLIWDPQKGSPLVSNTRELAEKMNQIQTEKRPVFFAMRYGKPNLEGVLDELTASKFQRIVCIPLYPQIAESSTGTALAALKDWHGQKDNPPLLEWVPPFFHHPGFIKAVADKIKPLLSSEHHLLLSYHGLPENHMLAQSCSAKANCLTHSSCCENLNDTNRSCYRAQCHATTKAVAKTLGMKEERVHTAFQSRLGRTKWIEPYTDILLQEFPRQGIQKLVVACPAFTSDCLETLEEIAIRGRKSFLDSGGSDFHYAPAVNDSESFAQGLWQLVDQVLPVPGTSGSN